MSGYSGTPLAKKLGIKKGHRLSLLDPPDGFVDILHTTLPTEVVLGVGSIEEATVIVAFFYERAELDRRVDDLLGAIDLDGGLWIAWPKRASKVPTDITEDTVREVFLPLGLVDNKVCAVDDTWSGLRVVWRKELRAARRAERSG